MIRLDPILMWVGAAAALLTALALAGFVRRRRRVAAALGDPALVRRLAGEDLGAVPWGRVVLVALGALALGAAVADPRWGTPVGAAEVRTGTVVLVLDASGSMLARDVVPNRLALERGAARALVRELPGAAVGIVVFAGRAYALSPPTVDPGAVELYLDALEPAMVTQTGSSLAAAIRQGLGLLVGGNDRTGGALVLISDGDALESSVEIGKAVDLAARAGIPVHVLGVGTEQGAPVPDIDFRTGREVGYKRDLSGAVAVSRLNETLLREVATETGGEYVDLADAGEVEPVVEALRAGGGAGRAGGPLDRPARYAWFAAAALALLVLEAASRPRARSGGP